MSSICKSFAYAWFTAAAVGLVAPSFGQNAQPAEKGAKQVKQGAEQARPALPLCPVMGGPINFHVSAKTDQGTVYFCCGGCAGRLDADPQKYAEKVKEQQAALAKLPRIQTACPFSGDPIDQAAFKEVDGEKVYFCCMMCAEKYDPKNPEHTAALGATYTYQTQCPVTGQKINPAAFTDLPTGERVYFCSKDCDKKFIAKPGQYAKNLAKQGYPINVKKLRAAIEEAGKSGD